MKKITAILFLVSVTFISCKKDDPLSKDDKSDIILHFDNIAGDEDLALNTATYTNANAENLTISRFDYYVSNIILKKVDGSQYIVPQNESYFLIKESDETTQELELGDIPVGDYNGITFTVGVDSLRSAADISQRTGVLDPFAGAQEMYWSWNSGYIFLKLEGNSPASTTAENKIEYHIGGFGGYDPLTPTINNIKTITLDFPAGVSAKIRGGKKPEVHLLADALKVLNGSTNIKIADDPSIMSGDKSGKVADNYKNMFIVDHVHND